ncbi:MAG: flagellar basal body P-ring formation chaperone FlgA [Syntrophaceae bacterium]
MTRTVFIALLCMFLTPLAAAAGTAADRQSIPPERLAGMYRDAILAHSPWKGKGEIVIEDVKAPTTFQTAPERISLVQAKFAPHEDFMGLTSVTLIFGPDGGDKVAVTGKVSVRASVPVPKQTIRRGQVIEASDLELRRIDISRVPPSIMDIQSCAGMRAKSFIRKGMPILLTNIEVPPLVYKGAPVMIEAGNDDLVVADKGVALMDGRADDRIAVKNLRSGRQIVGIVIAPSRVRVDF